MDVARIDVVATRGGSPLHAASPSVKLASFGLVLVGVIVSTNVLVVVGFAVALVGVAITQRLPLRPLLGLAAYPGLFAALFALAAGSDPLVAALVIAKAVTAALSVLLVLFTTPYPQVFAPIQRVLPSIVGDIALMTYRSLFLLLDKFTHTLTAVRLRAGIVGTTPIRSARAITRSLAGSLLYSLDLSQRTYDVMRLRGYEGRLVVSQFTSPRKTLDLAVLGIATVCCAIMLSWRLSPITLAPYAWIPLIAGAAVLLGSVFVRLTTRSTR